MSRRTAKIIPEGHMTTEMVESRKRELKQSSGLIEKSVDVSRKLLDEIPTTQLVEKLGSEVNHRDLMSAAISSHLPNIVSALLGLGIRQMPKGKQRPRTFDIKAWQSLEAAEKICGLPKVELLRACLYLLARKGVTQVDLQVSLDAINEVGADPG
jgi:hypothetical protein